MTIVRINRDPFAGRHREPRRPFGRIIRTAARGRPPPELSPQAPHRLSARYSPHPSRNTLAAPAGRQRRPGRRAAADPARQAQQAQMTTTATTTAKIKPNWQAWTCDAFAG